MGNDDYIERMIESQALTLQPPDREPERQYYFIKKARELVKKKSEELGYPLVSCIVNTGCQMKTVHEMLTAA